MAESNGNNGRKLNAGDLLHAFEIVVLLISIGISYERFNEAAAQVAVHTEQLSRMEHYLSYKDPQYWKLSRENQ